VVQCGAVWCSVVRCGAVRCGVVLCGAVWCSVVQCGAVWCGAVRCCVVYLWYPVSPVGTPVKDGAAASAAAATASSSSRGVPGVGAACCVPCGDVCTGADSLVKVAAAAAAVQKM
jgi:hypothetical protein